MAKAIVYDLTRLAVGPFSRTPRGIDRVELGCLTHLFESWPAACVGVLPTPWGVRWFTRERVLEGRKYLHDLWAENADIMQDAAYTRLRAALASDTPLLVEDAGTLVRSRDRRGAVTKIGHFARLLFGRRFRLGSDIRSLPADAVYLNLGHYGLAYPRVLSWLNRRPDVARLFMLHDAIPVQYPELVAVSTLRSYRSALAATNRYADSILVPSKASKTAVKNALSRMGAREIPIHTLRLPIEDVFRCLKHAAPSSDSYFVVVGAIEPRKNQSLLFTVWLKLIERLGDRAPKLVVAGPLGHAASSILKVVQTNSALARHIFIAPGLSTPALASTIAGARALLMPSIAEGFGLPPVEALALGVPAIVSDIPAHREAVGSHALFLDPSNADTWVDAIYAMTTDRRIDAAWRERARSFDALDWQGYMRLFGELIEQMEPKR